MYPILVEINECECIVSLRCIFLCRLRSSSFDSSYFRTSSGAFSSVKEESSDESTIISSQTSTLTRNQGPDDMDADIDNDQSFASDDDEDKEDRDDDEQGMMEKGMNAAEHLRVSGWSQSCSIIQELAKKKSP